MSINSVFNFLSVIEQKKEKKMIERKFIKMETFPWKINFVKNKEKENWEDDPKETQVKEGK